MSAATPETDLNARVPVRATLFLDPKLPEILRQVYGCRPVSLGIEVNGLPIYGFRIRRPLVDRFVLAPFNFQPVLAGLNEQIADALIGLARAAGPRASAQIRMHHPLPPEFVERNALSSARGSVETLVDLAGSAEAVMARMRPRHRTKWRAAARAAEAGGIAISPFDDPATLGAVYDVMLRAYRDKHRMIPQPLALFSRLISQIDREGTCCGYVAREEGTGTVAGGIIVLKDATQWCYGWGASSAAFEKFEIGTLLIGTALIDAARAGAPVFNLGASPQSHENLRRYKRGWGGVEHEIIDYHYREPPAAVDLHEGYPIAKKLIAFTPLRLIRWTAPIAVRWLV